MHIKTIKNRLFPKIELHPLPVEEDGAVVCFGGARKHWVLKNDAESYSVRYKYFVEHPNARGGKISAVATPLHFHTAQSETLAVKSGRLGYMLHGTAHIAGPGDSVTFKAYEKHSFWAEEGEDLVFDLTATPGEGLDGDFLDNFDGYLTCALAQGKRVPFLQLMVFCHNSQAIAVVCPPFDRFIVGFLGGFVGPLLGYKARYNELHVQEKSN